MADGRTLPIFIGILSILIFTYFDGFTVHTRPPIAFKNSYDYIIVGAGSSGAVVAARLSEDPDVKVLLLEAGGEDDSVPDIHVPWRVASLPGSEVDWKYMSVPQKHALKSFVNQTLGIQRGKALGGSSLLNYMAYVRGSSHDFDEWSANGNPGWSYKELLPYFKKSEHNTNPDLVKNGYHGVGGPITTRNIYSPLADVFIKAYRERGIPAPVDVNGGHETGYMLNQLTVDERGMRSSTSRGYLHSANSRENLHVVTYAHVTKVVVDNTTKTTIGVQFVKNNELKFVKIQKEVILSAGSIGSPQILMLSGIGPKRHLLEKGIAVVADLPVGDNLQDHVQAQIDFLTETNLSPDLAKVEGIWSRLQYSLFGTGPLCGIVTEGNAFLKSRHQPKEDNMPYIQVIHSNIPAALPNTCNYKDEDYAEVYGKNAGKPGMTLSAVLARPTSRGSVKLKSANPFESPLIDPNYLHEEQDIRVLREALRFSIEMENTTAFREVGAKLAMHPPQACRQMELNSDALLDCYIRHVGMTVFHFSSSCRMGPKHDANSVVDAQLRLKGIKGLRVADASIMPHLINANTNAACIMIGEKAADLIKGIV